MFELVRKNYEKIEKAGVTHPVITVPINADGYRIERDGSITFFTTDLFGLAKKDIVSYNGNDWYRVSRLDDFNTKLSKETE